MDSFKLTTSFLMTMIILDLNLAEAVKSHSDIASMMRPVFRKFEWRNLNGAPVENVSEEKSDSIESDADMDRNSPRAVYWIPTNCDPAVERGYTCVGCGESLHCMGGGFALKAVCWGRRPYCRNGVCGSIKDEKCDKISENHGHPPAGVMVGSGSFPDDYTTVPYDATTVPYHATTVPYDATTVPYHATTVPYHATTVPYHATTVPYHATTVPYHATTVPYHATTVPYHATTVPYHATTVPYHATTVPYHATTVPYHATTVPYHATTVPYHATTVPYDATTVPYHATTVPYKTKGKKVAEDADTASSNL